MIKQLLIACLAVMAVAAPATAASLSNGFAVQNSGTSYGKQYEIEAFKLKPKQRLVLQTKTVFSTEKEVRPNVWVNGVKLQFFYYPKGILDYVGQGLTIRIELKIDRSAPLRIIASGPRKSAARVRLVIRWSGSSDAPYGH